jgi:glycosyltransferase involved in cell wall biosynthesis
VSAERIVVLDVGDDYFHPSAEGWRWDWYFPVGEVVRRFAKNRPVSEFLYWGRIAPAPADPGEAKFAFPSDSPVRIIGARADGSRGARSHLKILPQIFTRGVGAVRKADIIVFRWPSLHSMLLLPFALMMRKTFVVRVRVDVQAGLHAAGAVRSPLVGRLVAAYTRWALRRATLSVCISRFLKEKYGNERTVILNECSLMESDIVPTFDRGQPPIILYVGRLTREKGVDILIRAAALMREGGVRLQIVGGGPERTRLEELASSLKADNVSFLGGISDRRDLADIYRRATVFVLPSRSEGLGCVLLEAMAAGTPIVATAVGGIPDLIRDGWNGLLVPSEDPGALAGAVNRMLTDAALRKACAENGVGVAEENTFERHTGRMIDMAVHAFDMNLA